LVGNEPAGALPWSLQVTRGDQDLPGTYLCKK
jgi:hypothetical protein